MTLDVNADYMSSPQAAKILRITYVGVAQLARQGKIPAVKIANRWLIPRAFVEEFAQTYEGKRGRPRKKRLPTEGRETSTAVQPDQTGLADTSALSDLGDSRHEAGKVLAANAEMGHPEQALPSTAHQGELPPADTLVVPEVKGPQSEAQEALAMQSQARQVEEPLASVIQTAEMVMKETGAASQAGDSKPQTDEVLDINAQVDHAEETPASISHPGELELRDTSPVSETKDSKREGDETFAVSAEVYHLDQNYDFELYEKGQITERARLIVARLKPKIPSLPQFSFRWDYRYEHLNVDIHGVEPAVVDWFMMGENGYTGHLPRRLGGPDRAFEAIIWLPVTFVFRGRLTLRLRNSTATEEDSPSAATTSGRHRRWWTKWPTVRPT